MGYGWLAMEGADGCGGVRDRRRLTSELLVTLRDLAVPLTGEVIDAVGHAYSSNSAVLVLAHLAAQGADRPGALGGMAGLSRGATSNMLRRFEDAGVIERVAGPGDGRSVVVSLTSEGRRTERRLSAAVDAVLPDLQPRVKEAIGLLVDLGATPLPATTGQIDALAGRRTAMAIAEAGIALERAIAVSGSVAEVMTLAALEVEGPCRVRRVAQMLGITTGGATRLITRLEDDSTVSRTEEVNGDARAVVVAITDAGEQRLDVATEALRPYLDGLLQVMAAAAVTPER